MFSKQFKYNCCKRNLSKINRNIWKVDMVDYWFNNVDATILPGTVKI